MEQRKPKTRSDTKTDAGPTGFIGVADSSVNSVFSNISESNKVVQPPSSSAMASSILKPSGLNTGATHKNSECLFCGQAIIDRSKSVKCGMCWKRTHFHCAESGIMDDNVLRAVGLKTTNLAFSVKNAPQLPSRVNSRWSIAKVKRLALK